jgi:hypothetical protein
MTTLLECVRRKSESVLDPETISTPSGLYESVVVLKVGPQWVISMVYLMSFSN